MKKQRKHYSPEEKVAILRRNLLEQVPISDPLVAPRHREEKVHFMIDSTHEY